MAKHQKNRSWDAEADVVVVGFGGAGAVAALDANEQGADVLMLESFNGGGSTAASGAVVYAGGGTKYQKEAGFEDTPEEMFKYLQKEIVGAVKDETLRRFCNESVGMIEWLEKQGVPFEASMCPFKTSYPTDDYYLYYSGSENNELNKAVAKPAPRGHRAKGAGISGLMLFHGLKESVYNSGIKVRCQTRIENLVFDDDGKVIGVEGRSIDPGTLPAKIDSVLAKINSKANTYMPPLGKVINSISQALFNLTAKPYCAKAKNGVILCAGGFMFNREMVKEHNPIFLRCLPLGTYTDNGTGIRMGQSAGGAVDKMDKMSAWRFYLPPEALMQGVLVNRAGERICSEDLYGAKQGDYIVENNGDAFLIFDSKTYKEAVSHLWDQLAFFQKITTGPMVLFTKKKAPTLTELAVKLGVNVQGLNKTMSEYNAIAAKGDPDPMGKYPKRFVPQDNAPFYAIDCSLQNFTDTITKVGIPTAAMTSADSKSTRRPDRLCVRTVHPLTDCMPPAVTPSASVPTAIAAAEPPLRTASLQAAAPPCMPQT